MASHPEPRTGPKSITQETLARLLGITYLFHTNNNKRLPLSIYFLGQLAMTKIIINTRLLHFGCWSDKPIR